MKACKNIYFAFGNIKYANVTRNNKPPKTRSILVFKKLTEHKFFWYRNKTPLIHNMIKKFFQRSKLLLQITNLKKLQNYMKNRF
jgi:hypothetical protein